MTEISLRPATVDDVDAVRQGQGIGKRMWVKLLERAQTHGLQSLRLDADPDAVPFYEAMGFQVVGDDPSGFIPGRRITRIRILL